MSFGDQRARARFQPDEQPVQPSVPREQPYWIHPGTPTVAGTEPDSLRSVLRAVRRSWWIIVLCALVAGGAGVAIARTKHQQYQASTYLLINGNTYQSVVAGGYNPTDPQQQQATIAGLLTPNLLASAARQAGLPPTATYSVTPAAGSNSNVMRIVATTRNARDAAALSRDVSSALVSFMQSNNSSQLRQAKAVLATQVRQARSANDRHVLTAELNNLNDLKALINEQVQIIEKAQSAAPIPVQTARSGAIGLVIGLLFGLAVSLMRRRELPALPVD